MQPGRLPENSNEGKWIAYVERLGYVPPCVRDASSWLPHPYVQNKRGEMVWYWMAHGDPPPDIQPPGERCNDCIFQEPAWSQGFAGCSHSWLHDRDGDCQVFVDRTEFLERQPSYENFCHPPGLVDVHLETFPYWSDGTTYAEFTPSTNLPSGYFVRLNMPRLIRAGAALLYEVVDHERWRRFWQWAERVTVERLGAYQAGLFQK